MPVGEAEAMERGSSRNTLKAIGKAENREWEVSSKPGREKLAVNKRQWQDM